MKDLLIPVLLGGGVLAAGAWVWYKCSVSIKGIATHTGEFRLFADPGADYTNEKIYSGSSDTVLLTITRRSEVGAPLHASINGANIHQLPTGGDGRSSTMKLDQVNTIELKLGMSNPGNSVSGTYTISVLL